MDAFRHLRERKDAAASEFDVAVTETYFDAVDLPPPAPSAPSAARDADYNRVFEALFDEPAETPKMGRYLVLGTLGRGAMGTVLRAFDPKLDRQVALKVLHPDLGEQQTSRLIREAQALAKVNHPNVVQVYEVGEFEGQAFVAMELVEGQTLREWMHQELSPDWRETIDIFRQLGAGLAAVHERGLVHRDFKPGNAIIDTQGRARVLDFGLVRKADELEEPIIVQRARTDVQTAVPLDAMLTQTGALMGTPAYMSPEQMKGREADARSDQFGFCVALYEALYGERPYRGDTMEALLANTSSGKLRRSQIDVAIPRHIQAVLRRGLSVNPAERFPSMEVLLIALEDVQSRIDAVNLRMLRLEMALGASLIFSFWLLDWFVLRQHVWVTLAIRFTLCAVAGSVYAVCRFRPRFAERHVDLLAIGANVVACAGLVAIVWIDKGLESYHFAGINLLVLCIGVMFLWPLRRAVLLNGLIYASVLGPLLFVPWRLEALDVVLANQFFLLSTMVITITAQRQRYDLQKRELRAQQERRRLEEEVAVFTKGQSSSGEHGPAFG